MSTVVDRLQTHLVKALRATEPYTKTDMVYLANGGFWLVLEQATGMLLSFALAIAFGHFASKDMYGNYKYVLSLASILSAVSLSGLADALTQSVAKGLDGTLTQAFRLQLRWSFPFVLSSLALAGYYQFEGNEFLGASLVLVAIFQPLLTAVSLFSGFLFAQKDFARGSLYLFAMNTFTFLALLIALFLGERAILLVATYFIARTFIAGFLFWKANKHARNINEDPSLLHFSTHLSAMNIIGSIADKLDSVIIFTLLGPANLAVYTFALAMPEQIKGLAKNLYGLALPKYAKQTVTDIKKNSANKFIVLTFSLTLAVLLYIVLAPFIFSLLFPLYMEAVPYSQLYAISIVLAGIPQLIVAVFTAHKKTKELYLTTNTSSVVLMISLLILVPYFGLWGAIVSQVLYRLAIFIFGLVLFVKVRE